MTPTASCLSISQFVRASNESRGDISLLLVWVMVLVLLLEEGVSSNDVFLVQIFMDLAERKEIWTVVCG